MSDTSNLRQAALDYHALPKPGKLEIRATKPLANGRDLARAYSPGVAEACLEIKADPAAAALYTARANLVAVVTNGTAQLSPVTLRTSGESGTIAPPGVGVQLASMTEPPAFSKCVIVILCRPASRKIVLSRVRRPVRGVRVSEWADGQAMGYEFMQGGMRARGGTHHASRPRRPRAPR